MLEARARISHFKPWTKQPDLPEGSSPLTIRSLWSDSDCAPGVLEKAVPLRSSAVFLRATTRWLQEWEMGREERDIKEALNQRKLCTAFNCCGGVSPHILPAADQEEQQETSHGSPHGYISLLGYPQNSYSEWEDKHGPHQAWEIVISQERAYSK